MIVFHVSLNFQSSERNTENTMSEYNVTIKSFAPPFFNYFSLSLNRNKCVVMRAMRKKLNMFTPQLPIY